MNNVGSSCVNPVDEQWTRRRLFTAPPAPCGEPSSYPRSSPGSPQRTVDEATRRIASNGAPIAPPSSQHPQKTEPPTTTSANLYASDQQQHELIAAAARRSEAVAAIAEARRARRTLVVAAAASAAAGLTFMVLVAVGITIARHLLW